MSRLAIITFLDPRGADVDNTLPGGPVGIGGQLPVYPSNALPPVPGHPGNALPPPGSIATLPVFPYDPTKPVDPEDPDVTPPIQIRPGKKFVVKWLACHGLILVPDQTLPATPQPK